VGVEVKIKMLQLPVHLVKDKTVPASEDAEPDELTLRVVRLRPIQAIQRRPPNTLRDDAIIHGHREKTALLSLHESRKENEKRKNLKKFVNNFLP
jgi:hypothetical protein